MKNILPEQFTIEDHPAELVITYRWRSIRASMFLFLFGFSIGLLYIVNFPFWLVSLLSFILVYYFLSVFFNHTIYTLNRHYLHIKIEPFSWEKPQKIHRSTISHLYIERKEYKVSRQRHNDYDLVLVEKGGDKHIISNYSNIKNVSF